jgi:hypothetical protein
MWNFEVTGEAVDIINVGEPPNIVSTLQLSSLDCGVSGCEASMRVLLGVLLAAAEIEGDSGSSRAIKALFPGWAATIGALQVCLN